MFPIRNFNFKLIIADLGAEVGFSEVSGYDAKIKEVSYREGTHTRNTVRKLPGLMEYGNITLKRGVDDKKVFFDWVAKTSRATSTEDYAKKVNLQALAEDGTTVTAEWELALAWPVSYAISEFKGDGNEVVFETVTLTHEGMTRVS